MGYPWISSTACSNYTHVLDAIAMSQVCQAWRARIDNHTMYWHRWAVIFNANGIPHSKSKEYCIYMTMTWQQTPERIDYWLGRRLLWNDSTHRAILYALINNFHEDSVSILSDTLHVHHDIRKVTNRHRKIVLNTRREVVVKLAPNYEGIPTYCVTIHNISYLLSFLIGTYRKRLRASNASQIRDFIQ